MKRNGIGKEYDVKASRIRTFVQMLKELSEGGKVFNIIHSPLTPEYVREWANLIHDKPILTDDACSLINHIRELTLAQGSEVTTAESLQSFFTHALYIADCLDEAFSKSLSDVAERRLQAPFKIPSLSHMRHHYRDRRSNSHLCQHRT